MNKNFSLRAVMIAEHMTYQRLQLDQTEVALMFDCIENKY